MNNGSIPQLHVLNLQTDPANWKSTAPLSIGVAYQVGDSWIRVNSLGIDANGIERAATTVWANSSLCVH
ncbi:MAG TPA: hypothetical protein VJV79_23275 [Polyangiaceae bacterium]|nr:hypothetical protein [Polyangiaceae bacterium]